MKKVLASLLTICLLSSAAFSQGKIRPQALGISFIMNDYTTAQRIRSGSINQVIRDDQWSKFNAMSPGLAITYFKGLKSHLDFAGTLAASFVNYSLPEKSFTNDAFLLEADASVNLKILDESYWVIPYLSAGLGASRYRVYYGAFVPLGAGFRINLFDEASINIGTQYRVPVTAETSGYHFMYSIGISGVLGKKD